MKSGISVIVCCYNSAARISKTLSFLAAQKNIDADQWEVVLVDNASTDETASLASRIWRELDSSVSLQVVQQPIPGLAHAREKGVNHARFELLLFCDDDNWLDPLYLATACEVMNTHPEAAAAGGQGAAVTDGSLPDWFSEYKYNYAAFAQSANDGALNDPLASLYGAGMIIRKNLFEELNRRNYRPLLTDRQGTRLSSGGDTELCYALRLMGHQLWYDSRLKFEHYMPSSRLTPEYLLRLNAALAYSRSQIIVYSYVLKNQPVSNVVWVKDVLYQLLYVVKTWFTSFSHSDLERKMAVSFSWNSLVGILKQAGQYKSRYRAIQSLKSA